MVFTYNANSFRAMMISTYKAGQHTQTHAPTFLQHQWKQTSLFSVRPEGLINDLNEFAKRYLPLSVENIGCSIYFFQLTIQGCCILRKSEFITAVCMSVCLR